MILSARAPVRWPTPDQFDLWWRQAVVAAAASDVDVDDRGHLRDRGNSSPIRLVSGTLGQPGSRYALDRPGLTAELDAVIEDPRHRLQLTYRPPLREKNRFGRRDFDLAVDSLALPRIATLRGKDAYLEAEGRFAPLDSAPLDLQVRLAWLDLRLMMRREPSSHGREDLVLELEVAARHAWKLPAAPILALLRRFGAASGSDSPTRWRPASNRSPRDPSPRTGRGPHPAPGCR